MDQRMEAVSEVCSRRRGLAEAAVSEVWQLSAGSGRGSSQRAVAAVGMWLARSPIFALPPSLRPRLRYGSAPDLAS